ncbi:MAG: DUF2922 domain-containing protein [Bacillota bacterium]|nr:DUF2922 domain-containing protein [Bacillota bacterium]MEA1960506.1 DUF2922 domain-containing protein [Bacillota bacterium]
MATQRTLEMDFATELGKTQRIRVYDAKDPLTDAEVAAAMDNIVAKNIFTGSGGNITGKIAARTIVTEKSELNLV